MFTPLMPFISHRQNADSTGHAIANMPNKSIVTVSSSIILTILCGTTLAILVVLQSTFVFSAIAVLLLALLLASQFFLARYHSTQILRTARYQQLGRKLVHIKRTKKRDETVALKVLNHIVNQPLAEAQHAKIWQRPFEDFSGDLAIACQSESGKTYTLVADLTGHGIAAAMGATPVASIFQATARRGLGVEQIVIELNNKLTQLLPPGFFCCAAIAECDGKNLTVCNAGLPDLIIVASDGQITDRIESTLLPLGIEEMDVGDVRVFTKTYPASHQMYAFTDGLIETKSANDEVFDSGKLEQLISSNSFNGSRMPTIQQGFENFVKGSQQSDDISMVEVNIC